MPVTNKEVAAIFNKLADLLEIDGANPFRVRAYRDAAALVGGLGRNAAEMIEQGEDLSEFPGIGKDLAGKIKTAVESGSLPLLEELEQRVPEALIDIMHISGLGPKRVKALHEHLDVDSLEDLERAVREGRVRELSGFGEKTEQNILKAIQELQGAERRSTLLEAEQAVEPLVSYLREASGVKRITVAGSYRRRRETVGDLDILVTAARSAPVMERFCAYEQVREVVSHGETRSTVRLRSGLQVDLRVVPEASYGAAMHYFTGSKGHNIAVRKLGVRRSLKINEYGVFRNSERVAGKTEAEVFERVGLPFIEPELRENRGEIEAAQEGRLPKLIRERDVRGDLHVHTDKGEGSDSLEKMVRAAHKLGYAYLAITDCVHSRGGAGRLDGKALRRQMKTIEQLNEKLDDLVVLAGAEVEILEDGFLDFPDDALAALDLTFCVVRDRLDLPRERQTERIIRAMDNPYFNVLAHPSGRLLGEREACELDVERLMEAASERGCFLELSAQPRRLDLTDVHCKLAKEMGVKVAVCSDARGCAELDHMRFGLGQARRGWLEKEDVLNTHTLKQLRKILRRK